MHPVSQENRVHCLFYRSSISASAYWAAVAAVPSDLTSADFVKERGYGMSEVKINKIIEDRDYLKAGDIYPRKISDYINSADLFILCWSQNAAGSDYVGLERSQALSIAKNTDPINGTLTIHPISITPRADLPDDMKDHYNFDKI